MDNTSNIFDNLYNNVKTIFGDIDNLNTQKIVILTPRIIQLVQEVGLVNKLSGQEKKHLFFLLINKLISSSNLDNDSKKNLNSFVNDILPTIVDAIVFAYKSEAFDELKKKINNKCNLFCKK
jgi:hypothetical protein